jgi:hypothetical protein
MRERRVWVCERVLCGVVARFGRVGVLGLWCVVEIAAFRSGVDGTGFRDTGVGLCGDGLGGRTVDGVLFCLSSTI